MTAPQTGIASDTTAQSVSPSAGFPQTSGTFTAAVLAAADPVSQATAAVIDAFNRAFYERDPAAIAPLVAEDCVIEAITPAPDGALLLGKAAALANWQGLASETHSLFEQEEVLVAGDRALIRWRYVFGPSATQALRGVNIMRVRDGRIVEAMGYAKRPAA